MNSTFDRLYSQLGRATFVLLLATLAAYGLTLCSALLGLFQAVISFRGATASLAYAFIALLGLFLAASLVATVIRWLDRRSQPRSTPSA